MGTRWAEHAACTTDVKYVQKKFVYSEALHERKRLTGLAVEGKMILKWIITNSMGS
jgi:hypothetical protein